MDSIGSGEILVIALVALLALDPRQAGRWWGKFRHFQRRLLDLREGFEREVQGVAAAVVDKPPEETAQSRLRDWARQRMAQSPQHPQAGEALLARLRETEVYRQARDVALFWSIRQEIPTLEILEGVLADGKRLWLPWMDAEPGIMDMAPVADLGTDLVPGPWGTREPAPAHRGAWFPAEGLVVVPGEVFDTYGGRIGKGQGYYDRWLALNPKPQRMGLCWDEQVHPGRLPQAEHDQPMGHLLTPERTLHF